MNVNYPGLPQLALIIPERLEASSVQKLQELGQHLHTGGDTPVLEPCWNNQDKQDGVGGPERHSTVSRSLIETHCFATIDGLPRKKIIKKKSWIGAFSVLAQKINHTTQNTITPPLHVHANTSQLCSIPAWVICAAHWIEQWPRVLATKQHVQGQYTQNPTETAPLALSTNIQGKRNPYFGHIGVPRHLDFPRWGLWH